MNDTQLEQLRKELRDYRAEHGEDEHTKAQSTKISCISMINSILAYGGFGYTAEQVLYAEEHNYHNYLKDYTDKLGRDTVLELIQGQLNSIDHVDKDVYTDCEGLSYNSISWRN